MLELILTLQDQLVSVRVNGQESHQFPLLDLSQTKAEWKDFLDNPRVYGEKLFNVLFQAAAQKAFGDLSKQTKGTIVLVLESSELDSIAWEYAYHDNAYIVEDFAFVRALPEKERPHVNGRLRKGVERVPLLFIPANPLVDLSGEPMHELDIESEWREMTQHIVKSNAPFDMIELRPATPAALQSVMARFQNGMIAHFSGHGAATKDGAFLLFERENGASNPLEAREFVREVKDQAWIGFLSACQSAVAERTAYSNLARELVKAGVPFALGMQFNLPDLFAPNISGQFYNYLSQGHAVPEAARQARRAVKRENEFYVGMIALYAAHPDEAGKMGWSGSGARTLSTFAEADVSDLTTPSGFIGRQRELMNIGTKLLGKNKPNTVTLHGAGGIGKTALMRQALLRFAPSFESALAIALDPLPSLESVLGRLERFLNLPSPCANDTKERERIVSERLTSKRTLLGLDNFETLNYALNEKDNDEERTAKSLHSFFKYLAANGVTLCVTSREVTNLGGEVIIDIEGLPNDIGGKLFQENVVKQKGEIYIEKTQQVSEMVGGHPLALRLLASAFDDQVGTSLDQYIESLQSFLPKARDKWTEEDRHVSLRASFDFTMNNLLKTKEGKKLQTAMARLSVFINFFFEFTAMPILENGISENKEEQKQARSRAENTLHALWERGLLECVTIASPDENWYLYRLHPALGIFAKERLTDVETVKENYWKSMSIFAGIAQDQITKSPLMAQTVLRAVPDLIFTSESKLDRDSALMRHRVGRILKQFGLYDESIGLLNKSLEICENIGDLQSKSVIQHELAQIYVTHGNLNRAMKLYEQCLEIDENLGNQHGEGATLHGMADIYFTIGDLDGAMKFYQMSLAIFDSLGELEGKSATLHQMAEILYTRGDLDGAMKLYQQVLKIEEGLGELKGKSSTLRWIAAIETTRGNLDTALDIYEQTLDIADQLADAGGKSSSLYQMANIYFLHGDLDEAVELYQQSLEIREGLGDLQGEADSVYGLAHIYFMRGNLDDAMNLYQQSLEISESLGDLNRKATTLLGMADIYKTRGDLDDAMKLYQQSLEIFESLGYLQGKASVLNNMGTMLFRNNQFPAALRCFVEALAILEKVEAHPDAQAVAGSLVQFRQVLGTKNFDRLWQEEIKHPIPEWLAPNEKQGIMGRLFKR